MNLDKLRPAWEQFKFLQQFNPVTEAEILAVIGTMEPAAVGNRKQLAVRVLQQVIIGLFLIFCCRGG